MTLVPDRIVIERSPGETRAALMAGDTPLAFDLRRDGDLVSGERRVGRLMTHSGALAFVEIGDTVPAVMKAKAAPAAGAAVAVEVIVPRRGHKGAEVTAIHGEVPPGKVPRLLTPAPSAAANWRAYAGTITAAPPAFARALQTELPDVPITPAPIGLFARDGLDAALEEALDPVVPLPGGARLIIETTAAATTIDIDAGPATPQDANAAALPAIAQALRLRNLSGHILIDVIPTRRGGAKDFAAQLRDLVAADPVSTQVVGTTALGMVELTRRRMGLSLAEHLASDPVRTAAYALIRAAVRDAVDGRKTEVTLSAAPAVVERLETTLAGVLAQAAAEVHARFILQPRPWPVGRSAVG